MFLLKNRIKLPFDPVKYFITGSEIHFYHASFFKLFFGIMTTEQTQKVPLHHVNRSFHYLCTALPKKLKNKRVSFLSFYFTCSDMLFFLNSFQYPLLQRSNRKNIIHIFSFYFSNFNSITGESKNYWGIHSICYCKFAK